MHHATNNTNVGGQHPVQISFLSTFLIAISVGALVAELSFVIYFLIENLISFIHSNDAIDIMEIEFALIGVYLLFLGYVYGFAVLLGLIPALITAIVLFHINTGSLLLNLIIVTSIGAASSGLFFMLINPWSNWFIPFAIVGAIAGLVVSLVVYKISQSKTSMRN